MFADIDVIEKVLVAAVLGGLIGIERGESNTPAGLRTNMIIAISTCLFTVLCLRLLADTGGDAVMMAHIISGVGFLGAGTIFHREERTKGLTTAATIWLVAGIGMATGMGEYLIALFATAITLCVLYFLEPLSEWLNERGRERAECRCAKPHPAHRKSVKRKR